MRADALTDTLAYLLAHVPPPHAPLHERIGHEQALSAVVRMLERASRPVPLARDQTQALDCRKP
jgi:hypothetical protein